MRTRLIPIPAIFIGLLLITGCGGDDPESGSHDGPRPLSSECAIPSRDPAQRERAAARVEQYRALRQEEFASDLLGFREGPELDPPSSGEEAVIRAAVRFRKRNGLNTSRLLIRRLIRARRAHDPRVKGHLGQSFPEVTVARLEEEQLQFESLAFGMTKSVANYGRYCAKGEYGGAIPIHTRPKGGFVVARFTGSLGQHEENLQQLVLFPELLRVRRVPFTYDEVRRAADCAFKHRGQLREQGITVWGTGSGSKALRAEIEVEDPSRAALAAVRRVCGPAVKVVQGGPSLPF